MVTGNIVDIHWRKLPGLIVGGIQLNQVILCKYEAESDASVSYRCTTNT